MTVFAPEPLKPAAKVETLSLRIDTEPTMQAIEALRDAIDNLAAACARANAKAHLRVDLSVGISTGAAVARLSERRGDGLA